MTSVEILKSRLASHWFSMALIISASGIQKERIPGKSLKKVRDFPGGPVVKTSPSNAGGTGSIPGWGAKIPHASWPKNQNIKQK